MTTAASVEPSTAGNAGLLRLVARRLVILGAPSVLAVVLWFHPHAGTDVYANLEPVGGAWFLVHVLLLPLYGLLGAALYLLLAGYDDAVAAVGRVGIGIYLVAHTAYEAIVGVGTGIVLRGTRGLPPGERTGVEAAVTATFSDPLVGALALIGAVGSLVAVVAIAVRLRRSGAPFVALGLLFGFPLGTIAHGNAGGAIFTGLFVVGAAWLELGWRGENA